MNYTYESIDQILRACEDHDCSFAEVVLRSEMETYECSADSIYRGIDERLRIFEESIQEGLKNRDKTISSMSGGHGAQLLGHRPLLLGDLAYKAMTYAILVNEANAKMFRIVACPTAGSCGILPGCLQALKETHDLKQKDLRDSFLVAAGIGNVIMERACVAGAVGGCQAEVGTAAAMTAGAVTSILGGTAQQIASALALSLKNVLGLVCDPVAGLVEVPCVKRNGIFAVQALTAAELALGGIESQIPADQVIDAMNAIGRALPEALRETSTGGLAVTPRAREIAQDLSDQ